LDNAEIKACFTFEDWLRKLSQPIRSKTKTNRDLITRAFMRLTAVLQPGVANGKFKTLRDGEAIVFLCEPETLSILKLRATL